MAAGLAMTVSYISVILVILIILVCVEIMRLEESGANRKKTNEWEIDEGIGWLTVVVDKRKGKHGGNLKGTTYSLSENERLGSSSKADTVIRHPAVEKIHVALTYKKPGRVLVKGMKRAVVVTSRKAGELMDGDRLILGDGDNRIELQLSFINHSDIAAAGRDEDAADKPRRSGRMPKK